MDETPLEYSLDFPPNVSVWSGVGVSGSEVASRPDCHVTCFQTTVLLRQPLLRKSNSLNSRGRVVVTKMRGQKQMSGTLHWVDWSLVVSLKGLAKLWFQTNYGTSLCLWATVVKGFTGQSGCLASSEGSTNWSNSRRLPVGYRPCAASCCLAGQTLEN